MAELHSITGFFNDLGNIAIFGGYMIVKDTKKPSNITGFLTDVHGESEIVGKIEENSLAFTKIYRRKEFRPIFYNFHLENGIWKGEYRIPDIEKINRAVCKTNLCWGDLEIKTYDSDDPDGWAKFMIDGMINDGLLEEFKDSKTGETLIRPK